MRIAIGADHNGFQLKQALLDELAKRGHQVRDLGCHDETSVDYPDVAQRVAEVVAQKECEEGILICGTGIGMSITANKVPGVRAALCHDVFAAQRAREHNDANVLCLGGSVHDITSAKKIVKAFLGTEFQGDQPDGSRHARRVKKIADLEQSWKRDN
ncbi:MAG: ribose 5-phosphate isomerase B [Chloroflexi bacterium]|nr:ribose 5-phosphate isomerase B [Chloroflexota bacterium]